MVAGPDMRPMAHRWIRAGLVATLLAAVLLGVEPTASAAASDDTGPGVPGPRVAGSLPDHVPPAALAPEPELPAPAGWPFPESFPRTSGTGRLDQGASYWSDYLYDDVGNGYAYPEGDHGDNGADIFRVGIGADADDTYWRVDWNTLIDPAVPMAMFLMDTDAHSGAGVAEWPARANVRSDGVEVALLVSAADAWIIDASDPTARRSVSAAGGEVLVDMDARSFVVRVPRTLLQVDGTWVVRMGAGLAGEDGDAFRDAEGAEEGEPNLYNLAFRSHDQESVLGGESSNTDAQTAALADGDVSAFSATIRWADLSGRVTENEPMPVGYTSRWFVSSLELGQGVASDDPVYLGRVQQYAVYVPTSHDPSTPTPLTWLLKPASQRYTFFYNSQPDFVQWACEERGSICASIEQRGPSGGYVNEAELDFWEVWNRLAIAYHLDPDRTVIGGVSQGGVGTGRFTRRHPDLFARAFYLTGGNGGDVFTGPYDDSTTGVRVPIGVGGGYPTWENVKWVPQYLAHGGPHDLAYAQSVDQARTLDRLGFRYRQETYPVFDHLLFAAQSIPSAAAFLGSDPPRRVRDPGHIVYRWQTEEARPELGIEHTGVYWLHDLQARDESLDARVEVDSAARPDPEILERRREEGVMVEEPAPATYRELTWVLGPPPPTRSQVTVALENVHGLRIDLVRAGIAEADRAVLHVASDGPAQLQLDRVGPATQVLLDGVPVITTASEDTSGQATVAVEAGDHEIVLRRAPTTTDVADDVTDDAAAPTSTASPPAPAPQATTVPAASSPSAAGDQPLPATGGGAALGALFLLAAAGCSGHRGRAGL